MCVQTPHQHQHQHPPTRHQQSHDDDDDDDDANEEDSKANTDRTRLLDRCCWRISFWLVICDDNGGRDARRWKCLCGS